MVLIAFSVSIKGEDSLSDGEKAAFERHFVEEVRALVDRFAVKPGISKVKWSIKTDTLDDQSGKDLSDG